MAETKVEQHSSPVYNGKAIPCWTESGKEYLLLQKFPHLQKRFHSGMDCLEAEERSSLHALIRLREEELRTREDYSTVLHHKVSLLAGGNLAHVETDAVVNASNHWLSAGKGTSSKSRINTCMLYLTLSVSIILLLSKPTTSSI